MSLPYDSDIALPHAGLLSYFRRCDKTARTTQDASPIRSDLKYGIFEEEAQCSFWDSDSTYYTDTDYGDLYQPSYRRYQCAFHTLYGFWGFVCLVTLAACAALLGLDLALEQFGVRMWIIDCIMGKHLTTPPMAHELQFCLAAPNREAPGPQTWRLMSARSYDKCTTERITLLVGLPEEWKLHSGDGVVVGDEQRSKLDRLRVGKSLGGDGALAYKDLGDNIAEEGVLSQSGEETLKEVW